MSGVENRRATAAAECRVLPAAAATNLRLCHARVEIWGNPFGFCGEAIFFDEELAAGMPPFYHFIALFDENIAIFSVDYND